jgi:hypothetical protein
MVLKRSSASSAGANNDFVINTGSSGHRRSPLSKTFPAGTYTVTSSLGDTTYDVYLIGTDGTNAGSVNAETASTTITATKEFNVVVVYGIGNNDTLSFAFKNVYNLSSDSTSDLGAAPLITSTSSADLPNQNNTTTIIGKNFASDIEVAFKGTDNVARAAKSIVRSNSTELIVTRPDNMPPEYAPYTIELSNPGVASPTRTNVNKLSNSTTAGNAPVWVTPVTLNRYKKNQSFSQSIAATDADGSSSVTYSIVSSNLPSGITFNTSTGVFSGTATVNNLTPYTAVVRVTDSGGNYVDRTFSLSQDTPDAPTITSVTDVGTNRAFNNGAVSVAFNAPAFNGGSAITSYTVTSNAGHTGSGSSSPIVVGGLSSNTSYTFTITATNANGTSLSSDASSSVTATTVPQAPTVGTVNTPAVGVFSASVPFTANANGGKAITSYIVASNPSSLTGTGASSPITVSGLAQNIAYTYSVAAINANGTSAYSSASNSTTTSTTTLSDSFNRGNGALGTSSDGISSWSVQRGNFSVDSSMAYSSDTNNSIATLPLSSSTITNAQADMYADQGGVGLSFWVTDANSWWGIYPSYTSTTTTGTSTSCTGGALGGTYAYESRPANTCGQSCSSIMIYVYCAGTDFGHYTTRNTCGLTATQQNNLNNTCQYDWYIYDCRGGSCTINATNVTNTNYTTNYTSDIKIVNQSGVQHSNTYASSLNPTRSLAISTSGNTISYTGYSAAGKGGSAVVSSSFTPSSPTKGNRVGVIKASSPHAQGSYVDNIAVTVA